MFFFRHIKGEQFTTIDKLSENSIRMPMRLYGLEWGEQRNHKVTISISCSGPQKGKVKPSELKILRKREEADLLYTTNDADWNYQSNKNYFNEKGYDAGVKEKHIRLVNPTLKEVDKAIIAAGQYFKSFKNKKNWRGGEILLIYAGHGMEASGDFYISGDFLSANDLLRKIVENLPLSDHLCRIDLRLDSCYSGAFIGNFVFEIHDKYSDKVFHFDSFGSCLYDEVSLECPEWKHGILTYAMKQNQIDAFEEPKGKDISGWQEQVKSSLNQGGVVYLSGGTQHAFNLRGGDLQVFGSTLLFNIFEETGSYGIAPKELYEFMDKQRNEVNLIDFTKPYSKEIFFLDNFFTFYLPNNLLSQMSK
jgi:hypothetical protein